jgi:hypothetical protein
MSEDSESCDHAGTRISTGTLHGPTPLVTNVFHRPINNIHKIVPSSLGDCARAGGVLADGC